MKPPRFDYLDPRSLSESMDALAQHGDDGKVLAGGQSLVPLLNMRLAQPSVLIDLNRVPELSYIRRETRGNRPGFAIGAMTRHRAVEESADIEHRFPALHEGMSYVGHPQIRTRGTIGGSIAHADPAAELPLLFLMLEGEATVRSHRGVRTVAAADFFQYTFTTAVESDELLAEVWFPDAGPATGQAFVEVARRHGDFALVAAAASIALDGQGLCSAVSIAVGGAAPVPLRSLAAERSLLGQRPSLSLFRETGRLAEREMEPTGDIHADAEYRREVAGTLVTRALTRAWERVPRRDA